MKKEVKSLTGRRRRLHTVDSVDVGIQNGALRQAVNTPVQSSGSDCTLKALILINEYLKENYKSDDPDNPYGYDAMLCLTVHDSLMIDVKKDIAIEVAAQAQHIMSHLYEYDEKYEFSRDVPLVAEIEIGYRYSEMFETDIETLKEEGLEGFIDSQVEKKRQRAKETILGVIEDNEDVPEFVPIQEVLRY